MGVCPWLTVMTGRCFPEMSTRRLRPQLPTHRKTLASIPFSDRRRRPTCKSTWGQAVAGRQRQRFTDAREPVVEDWLTAGVRVGSTGAPRTPPVGSGRKAGYRTGTVRGRRTGRRRIAPSSNLPSPFRRLGCRHRRQAQLRLPERLQHRTQCWKTPDKSPPDRHPVGHEQCWSPLGQRADQWSPLTFLLRPPYSRPTGTA